MEQSTVDERTGDQGVTIPSDQLIVGRTIEQPIFDGDGVLLLAAGMAITSEFKKLLAARNVATINVSKSDAGRISLAEIEPEASVESLIQFDTELTSQLDSLVDSGLLIVADSGPPAKESLVFHGKKAYDPKKRAGLVANRESACIALDDLIARNLKGERLDAFAIKNQMMSSFQDMIADSDCALAISGEDVDTNHFAAQSLQTSTVAMAIAIEMGLGAESVRKIGITGIFENWGIRKIPNSILYPNHPRTRDETLVIKKHPIYSLEMLERMNGIPSIVPLISYQIHERLNGSGYPRGRQGNAIHLFARILAVASTYTSLTTQSRHHPSLNPYATMDYLIRQASEQSLDPQCVRGLLQALSLFPIGSYVALSDGSVAKVIRRNGVSFGTPIVQLIQDSRGDRVESKDPASILDLAEGILKIEYPISAPGRRELMELPPREDCEYFWPELFF